ncbi:MAG TPA: SGNH/GDSL hydrolase family protein [Stellaceae bacterium]
MGTRDESEAFASRSPRGGWRANALLAAASLILSLLLAEAVLRWAVHDYPQFNMLDPTLGWRPRPAAAGWFPGEVDSYVAMNREGYRDVDHAVAKTAGTYRIVILGDSMTEGREVEFGDLYWKQLESLLPQCPAFVGRDIEVISLAANGYGTAQEYLTLREKGLKFRPDLVLLALFTGNDFTDNVRTLGRHRDRPYFAVRDGRLVLQQTAGDAPDFAARQRWDELRRGLLDPIRLVQVARQAQARLRQMLRYGRPDPNRIDQPGLDGRVFVPPVTREWEQAWRMTEALILAIADCAHGAGAAFALTTLTNPLQVLPDTAARDRLAKGLGVADLTYPDRRLEQFSAANGFPDMPLVDALASYAAEHHAALHGPDPSQPIGHWNQLGHHVAAVELAHRLCDQMAAGRLAPPSLLHQSGSNTFR